MNRVPRRNLDGILLLDKPLGLSSNQALQVARRVFGADKAGHTGSLDPLATGMLPICFGEATKLCGLLLDSDKAYVAHVRLGQRTRTGDAEGEVIQTSDASALTLDAIVSTLPRFLGAIQQTPPMYSALKHQGRRLYELAREGQDVERAPRTVLIRCLEVISYEGNELVLAVGCSKGTYIRTLAEDLAAALGQCAHLSALRRTAVDPFGTTRTWRLDDLAAMAEAGTEALDAALLPLAAGLSHWHQIRVPDSALARLSRGQAVDWPTGVEVPTESVNLALLDEQGVLRAVGRRESDGRLGSRRWLGGPVLA